MRQLGTYRLLHLDGHRSGEIHDIPAEWATHGFYAHAVTAPLSVGDPWLDGTSRTHELAPLTETYDLHLMRAAIGDTLVYVRVAQTSGCSSGRISNATFALAEAVKLILVWRGAVGLDEGRAWWVEQWSADV